jgi:hypothetical protein
VRVKVGGATTVSAIVVVSVSEPEVPVMVTVTGPPTVAVLEAVKVSTLVLAVVGLGLKLAVTPLGCPLAERVTPEANPLAGVTVMVSLVLVAPCVMEREPDEGESEKVGAAVTVTAMVVVFVNEPEVPVMVIVTGPPMVAVLDAVRVSTLVLAVVGLGLKLAVTPVGSPLAERVTPEANPLAGVTVMVSLVLVAPWAMDNVPAVGESEKVGAAATVSASVVVSLSEPEVPVMVTVTGPPTAAVLEAVRVNTLVLAVVGLGLKLAVTPLGSPLAESVTPEANPLAGVTVMVSLVLVAPCVMDNVPVVGESEKVGAAATVSAMVVVSVSEPETPEMVTVTGPPTVAVLDAVRVNTLESVVVGFGLKLAVTPLGSPLAESVTPELNPLAGVTVMVSLLLVAPCAIDKVPVVGTMVNVGGAVTVS